MQHLGACLQGEPQGFFFNIFCEVKLLGSTLSIRSRRPDLLSGICCLQCSMPFQSGPLYCPYLCAVPMPAYAGAADHLGSLPSPEGALGVVAPQQAGPAAHPARRLVAGAGLASAPTGSSSCGGTLGSRGKDNSVFSLAWASGLVQRAGALAWRSRVAHAVHSVKC
jgi:hypothetical protein